MPVLDSTGNIITATKNFAADGSDGTIDMEFTLDSTGLGDHILVVFEDILIQRQVLNSQPIVILEVRSRAFTLLI